jgi:hypothetical protein
MGKRMKTMPLPALRWIAVAACFVVLGCGARDATVSGKITYGSQSVTRGQISFVAADGKSASGTIHADGAYEVTQVPQGEVVVVVSSVAAEGEAKFGAQVLAKAPKRLSLIPERYNDADTSPLKYTISGGSQKIDIQLED